ncbi:MAG: glucose-1-phosphate adenylyltransferase [Bryobacteraceae bacterium]|nr:glucose-1-phosphate adenylyltransferase [Bryobacteraceae bacterium]
MKDVLTILLAGGAGERLLPLTRSLAKPAVPFGGHYRIVDFTLSNIVNSGLRRILVMTQYKSLVLHRHLREGWNIFSRELGEYLEVLPPMKRIHSDWYLGTADAVYQNIESIEQDRPELVLILSGDHIYKMDYREMMDWHRSSGASATIATIQVPPADASRYGILDVDPQSLLCRGFEEKPAHGNPCRSAFNPFMVSASMGIYLFKASVLLGALRADAADPGSSHDFGHDVLPRLIGSCAVAAYDFHDLNEKTALYWRDVGTLDAYFEANMDLVSVHPEFNLYDSRWPLRTRMPQSPPAKFVFAQEGRRMGVATDSIVSPGVIISGGRVHRSILSPGVRVNSFCEIEDSILLPGATVGRYARLSRVIVDAGVHIPEGAVVGGEGCGGLEGCQQTEGGVTVVSEPREDQSA